MLTPYLTFFLQGKQDGQETSTRYCTFSSEGLAKPEAFGIPEQYQQEWFEVMQEGFALSKAVWEELDRNVAANPALARIPADATRKEAARMKKNYGLDRARYTLPLAALTNFGLIMTGREWADTLKYLDASPIPEQREIAHTVRPMLEEFLPHLMKHARETPMTTAFMQEFFGRGAAYIREHGVNTEPLPDEVFTSVQLPEHEGFTSSELSLEARFANAFRGKQNRYDIPRGFPEKVHVAVYWPSMAIAEARDINRQRPCQKDTLLAPHGFYMAPEMREAITRLGLKSRYEQLQARRATLLSALAHSTAPHSYAGALFLGDQTPFEMHTNAAHMTYVLELRTGRGVHFRYDEHMRQAFESFQKQLPAWTKHIALGTGEPE
ncbi:hypothetical protein D6789_03340 [Candidatus Woesearchaeota archaeon]|nr:MAG: hypothetical protein D6789_03340 [Candidatus Woesearchaeota archaeon]